MATYGAMPVNSRGTSSVARYHQTASAAATRAATAWIIAVRRNWRNATQTRTTAMTSSSACSDSLTVAELDGLGVAEQAGTDEQAGRAPVAEDHRGQADVAQSVGLPFW